MPKFKVGDTVRVTKDTYILSMYGLAVYTGKTGSIVEVGPDSVIGERFYKVKLTQVTADFYESMLENPDITVTGYSNGYTVFPSTAKAVPLVQPKPKFTKSEVRNGLQLMTQVSTGYKAWVNLQEAQLDGTETAWYDAFKYNYHPEGLTKKPTKEEVEIPF